VQSIIRKLTKAKKEREVARSALEDLSDVVDEEWLVEWKGAEAKAIAERGDFLRIYDVQDVKGWVNLVFLSSLLTFSTRLYLQRSPTSTGRRGEQVRRATRNLKFIDNGLRVRRSTVSFSGCSNAEACSDSTRVTLAIQAKSLLKRFSSSEKKNLLDRRQKIQTQLATYHEKCTSACFSDSEIPELGAYPSDWYSQGQADGEYDEDEEENDEEEEEEEEMLPETAKIFLPSNLSRDSRQQLGLEEMGRSEAMLRVGQANDALHRLRIALGEKSLLYRKQVRYTFL
jgi:hypothetical protein